MVGAAVGPENVTAVRPMIGPGVGLTLTVSGTGEAPPPDTEKVVDPGPKPVTVIVLPEMDGLAIPAGVLAESVHGPV